MQVDALDGQKPIRESNTALSWWSNKSVRGWEGINIETDVSEICLSESVLNLETRRESEMQVKNAVKAEITW